MTTEDIIIQVFCLVDDQMKEIPKQSNVLLALFHQLHPDADPFQMSIAEFSL